MKSGRIIPDDSNVDIRQSEARQKKTNKINKKGYLKGKGRKPELKFVPWFVSMYPITIQYWSCEFPRFQEQEKNLLQVFALLLESLPTTESLT